MPANNYNSQRYNVSASSSLFCKLCYDAGRADFDTHSIRNREGKLTCKYLASISCSKCGHNGHTVKYCRTKTVFQPISKSSEWSTTGSSFSVGIKKSMRRLESNTPMISNVLGGAFSALVVEDTDDIGLCSPMEECQEVKVDSVDNSNHAKIVGNNGHTVNITWAIKSKSVDLFKEFKNSERRSWADMVEDED